MAGKYFFIVSAMMAYITSGQTTNDCMVLYTEQPLAELQCNPYRANLDTTEHFARYACTATSTVPLDDFHIMWFRQNLDGTIEDLGCPIRHLDSSTMQRCILDTNGQRGEGSYWCVAEYTDENGNIQTLERSNIGQIRRITSYDGLPICSDTNSEKVEKCAIPSTTETTSTTSESSSTEDGLQKSLIPSSTSSSKLVRTESSLQQSIRPSSSSLSKVSTENSLQPSKSPSSNSLSKVSTEGSLQTSVAPSSSPSNKAITATQTQTSTYQPQTTSSLETIVIIESTKDSSQISATKTSSTSATSSVHKTTTLVSSSSTTTTAKELKETTKPSTPTDTNTNDYSDRFTLIILLIVIIGLLTLGLTLAIIVTAVIVTCVRRRPGKPSDCLEGGKNLQKARQNLENSMNDQYVYPTTNDIYSIPRREERCGSKDSGTGSTENSYQSLLCTNMEYTSIYTIPAKCNKNNETVNV